MLISYPCNLLISTPRESSRSINTIDEHNQVEWHFPTSEIKDLRLYHTYQSLRYRDWKHDNVIHRLQYISWWSLFSTVLLYTLSLFPFGWCILLLTIHRASCSAVHLAKLGEQMMDDKRLFLPSSAQATSVSDCWICILQAEETRPYTKIDRLHNIVKVATSILSVWKVKQIRFVIAHTKSHIKE